MLVHNFLEDCARRAPDSTALIEPSRTITYAALDRLANRFANALRQRGVRPHDRVVLAFENCTELVAGYFGTLKAGAVAVPLPHGPRSDRLMTAIADCTPRACIVDMATAASFRDRLPGDPVVLVARRRGGNLPGPAGRTADLTEVLETTSEAPATETVIDQDLAAIIYTSGSTGLPRGVMLRHSNIVANTQSIVSYLRLTGDDRVMCVLPLYYVYGLSLLHTHLLVGGSIVLDNRFVYPNVVLAAMQQHRVTGFAGVPSTFALLLHRSNLSEMPLPDLRYVTQAGGPMPPASVKAWLERGPRAEFFVMYGATEASARLTYLPPADLGRKLGSIGRAIPNTEILVLREDGQVAAPGEVGELVARGANISPGYWNNPDETAEKFGPQGYRTGDLGYADDDGFLYLVGRRHDMIKIGAQRVGATEIEHAIHEHPAVMEAAVVAAPHEILGEVPIAFVAVRPGERLEGEVLRAFCAGRLAPHKVPARVHFLKELPKTSGAGKIDKLSLKALAAAADGTAAAGSQRTGQS